jgi:hypothetical protein
MWVIDSRTDSITGRFDREFSVWKPILDHTGTYLYCTTQWDTLLWVIDTRDDSIMSRTPFPFANCDWPVQDTWNHRIYVAGASVGIPVIRDSIIKPGVAEAAMLPTIRRELPTVVRRGAFLRCVSAGALFDATGRRVAVLLPGRNNLSGLAPGVYFVCEEPKAADLRPQAVRKVVVTR